MLHGLLDAESLVHGWGGFLIFTLFYARVSGSNFRTTSLSKFGSHTHTELDHFITIDVLQLKEKVLGNFLVELTLENHLSSHMEKATENFHLQLNSGF